MRDLGEALVERSPSAMPVLEAESLRKQYGTLVANKTSLMEFAYHAAGILSFCAFLFLLLELDTVYQPIFSKIALLLAFLAIMHLLLPLMLAAMTADQHGNAAYRVGVAS